MNKAIQSDKFRDGEVRCNHAAFLHSIEYEIIGEGSQILTNQKRESTVFSLLIGRNLRPFPDNFVLHSYLKYSIVNIETLSIDKPTFYELYSSVACFYEN